MQFREKQTYFPCKNKMVHISTKIGLSMSSILRAQSMVKTAPAYGCHLHFLHLKFGMLEQNCPILLIHYFPWANFATVPERANVNCTF